MLLNKKISAKFLFMSMLLIGLISIFSGCFHSHEEGEHDHNKGHGDFITVAADPNLLPLTKADLLKRGETVFTGTCAQCHLANGTGIAGSIPPLLNSDYLMLDRERSIKILLQGLSGSITVNGNVYNGVMPGIIASNNDIAAVLTYVRGNLNGATDSVSVEEVAAVKGKLSD